METKPTIPRRPGVEDTGNLPSLTLLSRAQEGDRGALETLIARYRPRLQRWASGRLPRLP